MASVDECLREASDCARHAEQCSETGEQAIFMLMAKSWMRLAVQIDEVHASPSVAATGEEHADGEANEAASAAPEGLPDMSSPDIVHH